MDKPRPKFCVGEEVLCRDPELPSQGEITSCQWWENIHCCTGGRNHFYTGYMYALDGSEKDPENGEFDEGTWALESMLQKLPPEERTQWKDCAFQPNKQGVEA